MIRLRLFHRHRWKVVSAYCDGGGHWFDPGGMSPLMYTFVTNVVSRCECGELSQKRLAGKHSIEDLRGESSEIDRVLKNLELEK